MSEETLKQLKELWTTVQLACNPPDDCNDPAVLKRHMKACFDKSMEIDIHA